MPEEGKPPEEEKPETPQEPETEKPPKPESVPVIVEEQKPPTFATWTKEEKEKLNERLESFERQLKPKEEKRETSEEPKPDESPAPRKRRGIRFKSRTRK